MPNGGRRLESHLTMSRMATRRVAPTPLPRGFLLVESFLSSSEACGYVREFDTLPFSSFSMRGHALRRQILAFGVGFGTNFRSLEPADPMPPILLKLRNRAMRCARANQADFEQALVQRYPTGASIGFHVDDAAFGAPIVGVSFGCSARLRFRHSEKEGPEVSVVLPPGSLYVLAGAARSAWLHALDRVREQRYSVTFRTVLTRS